MNQELVKFEVGQDGSVLEAVVIERDGRPMVFVTIILADGRKLTADGALMGPVTGDS